jgi:SSS family solute:Na+ symporter
MGETEGLQSFAGALGWLDFAIVAGAIGVLLVIAYLSGRREKDTQDFFLGDRRVPPIIASLSFVATEISAMTIVAVPAVGYRENWQYLQFFIGSATARVLIAFLFIPAFYKYRCTTIYEFLRHRFGPQTQYAGSAFFLLTRLLASGVRLFVACSAVGIILGWPLELTLVLFTVVSTAFIAYGGIKAVVWTGAFETAVFFVAAFAVIGYLLTQISGGLPEAWRVASEGGRLSLFNLTPSLTDPTTLWGAAANGFFVSLAVFGTDQELMQRLLTVESRRSSQKALVGTILAALPLVMAYLAVGTLLYVFYHQNAALSLPDKADKILSHFTVTMLPTGLKGLVLAAVILASIDSPLNSLTSSFVTDIYRPLIRQGASERHYLWVSRIGVVVFGVLLILIAWPCQWLEGILWVGLQVFTLTSATLGVFLLGLLTKRVVNRGNVVAMVVSSVAMVLALYAVKVGFGDWRLEIGWTWLIVIGTAITFGLGYLFSLFGAKAKQKA